MNHEKLRQECQNLCNLLNGLPRPIPVEYVENFAKKMLDNGRKQMIVQDRPVPPMIPVPVPPIQKVGIFKRLASKFRKK